MSEKETSRGAQMLAEYLLWEKQQKANRYEREFFGRATTGEDAFLQARMYEIRTLWARLPACPEKLFLNLHFFRGHTVEKCAELMGVSRSTAFRLKRRGIARFDALIAAKGAEPSTFSSEAHTITTA